MDAAHRQVDAARRLVRVPRAWRSLCSSRIVRDLDHGAGTGESPSAHARGRPLGWRFDASGSDRARPARGCLRIASRCAARLAKASPLRAVPCWLLHPVCCARRTARRGSHASCPWLVAFLAQSLGRLRAPFAHRMLRADVQAHRTRRPSRDAARTVALVALDRVPAAAATSICRRVCHRGGRHRSVSAAVRAR